MRYARFAAALLASLLVLTFTARVSAAEGDKAAGDGSGSGSTKKQHLIHGHIKKIDGKTLTISVGKGDTAKEVTVQTDENTHFSIDHQDAKLEDLKEGELVAIAPAEGVAKHVDVNTTHKDKNKSGSSNNGGKTGDGGKAGGTGDKPKE